ncbi:MAG: hypothetical protein EP315_04240 [Gammaproteobacteria bacterium]|nr:MAG: hypothetical protein EP315_04240 [Gammaproteobacteria bacterium]
MSDTLLLEPTSTAQWNQLIKDAEKQAQCTLDEDIESYLIFTLIRFTSNPDLASRALAPDFLHGLNQLGHAREQQLRDVGDQCLLLSGLFPQRAEKRLVSIQYYVNMGRTAYDYLGELMSKALAHLYKQLSVSFIQLLDVLHNIRDHSPLQPLQAYDLWRHNGSQNAYRSLGRHSRAIPVILDKRIQH